ncbi:type VI secretion system baseplate subunit TssG [Labrys sp. La1]|uniref:type VI secretion system baseplate subunit TssG n=1 Tax=Labrys sp. La1 TaxID=3404917 RepID=UPI003EBD9A5E
MLPDRSTDALADLLERDPGRFEPTTAFRVAQAAQEQAAQGQLAITAHAGVSPAALPVSEFRRKEGQATLRSALAGLAGPLGSLPPTYNELIMREERNKSSSLAAFLQLFGARMDELFVDASEKYRLARLLRWGSREDRNGFIRTLLSLTGFGTARLRERSNVEDDVLLRFSGFFAARTRNVSNLRAILREVSGLPVEIELFQGRWLGVPEPEQSQMTREATVRLGVDAMAGSAIRDLSSTFRVVIGPLDYRDYLSLAPGSRNIGELFALTRLFIGCGLDFDIQVVLKKEHVPFCQLGQAGDPPRLGWNSWARSAPAARDSDDAVITERQATLQPVS